MDLADHFFHPEHPLFVRVSPRLAILTLSPAGIVFKRERINAKAHLNPHNQPIKDSINKEKPASPEGEAGLSVCFCLETTRR